MSRLVMSFWSSNICTIFPHLSLLVSHQLCEVLLILLLSKKLHMKLVGVVGKLGESLTQGEFPSHHNEVLCCCCDYPSSSLGWKYGTNGNSS